MSDFCIFLLIVIGSFVAALGAYVVTNWQKFNAGRILLDPGDLEATRIDQMRSYAYLSTTGREVFFPSAPHTGAIYEITIEGLLYRRERRFSDLLHQTGENGNFSYSSDWLRVNGSALSQITWNLIASDRYLHRYTLQCDARHERLTLALEGCDNWSGGLTAHVTVLPEGTPTIASVQAIKYARLAARKEEDKISAEFADQIKLLCARSLAFRNWADPTYRSKFAEAHGDDLIRKQSEIREEATTFLAQDQIVRHLRRHHPEVVERYLGRLEALLVAERIVVDKRLATTSPTPTPSTPRRKLTAEEVRSLKVRRQQVAIGDRVALLFDKVDTRLKIRERLDAMNLDTDERDILEQQLISEIEEGDDDHGNGKTI